VKKDEVMKKDFDQLKTRLLTNVDVTGCFINSGCKYNLLFIYELYLCNNSIAGFFICIA
jgi:hypothetical protein